MLLTLISVLACIPQRTLFCTREYIPVCGNGTTYNNRCLARAAGYYGDCESNLKDGKCGLITCSDTQFLSEKGYCVFKPWSDFNSCEEEKNQGACPGDKDPNSWVGEHCSVTCGTYSRGSRETDI